jgi:hypothetical protein
MGKQYWDLGKAQYVPSFAFWKLWRYPGVVPARRALSFSLVFRITSRNCLSTAKNCFASFGSCR